jgi:hypothetical protein
MHLHWVIRIGLRGGLYSRGRRCARARNRRGRLLLRAATDHGESGGEHEQCGSAQIESLV